jgi:phosphatidylinositol-bisphosphatase
MITLKKEDRHPLVFNFEKLWDDNEDFLSKQYAGTGKTDNSNSDPVKSLMGVFDKGVKAIGRIYMSNFEDSIRHECLQALAATTQEEEDEAIESGLVQCEQEFCTFEDVNVFVASYNIGGCDVSLFPDFPQVFQLEGNQLPEIFVFGFQEIVDLHPKKLLVSSEPIINAWLLNLQAFINSPACYPGHKGPFKEYQLVTHHVLFGLMCCVFTTTALKPRITKVSVDIVKTGIAGTVGNKGATIIKFNHDDTSLVFINCHLEAGQTNAQDRLTNLSDIHTKAFQQLGLGRKIEGRIEKYDYRFLFGDFNSRTNMSYQEALVHVDAIQRQREAKEEPIALRNFLNSDQLNNLRSQSEFLCKYTEGDITFLPSYKYDIGTQVYDTSKKMRVPSYCDRIMIWGPKNYKVRQAFYKRRELLQSDHRPVAAYYTVTVKKIDKGKRETLVKGLHDKRKTVKAKVEEHKIEQ